MFSSIRDVVASGKLPSDPEEIIPLLTNSDGTYLSQEGETWDFKETWPFSYSDEYFHGIARLTCAFSNTEGGLIVFGVNDKTRLGGRTKTNPNVDRFEQAFNQLTSVRPAIELRRYHDDAHGDIDVLLVKKKDKYQLPIKFNRDAFKYRGGAIWVRRGSEVCDADSDDIAGLYLRSSLDGASQRAPLGQLPPSPATVREFVGRMSTIDRVFEWLFDNEEPRSFLYGKGGSGKSTIAYEIFKNIRTYGGELKLFGEDLIDQVIYISAKAKSLNVETQKSESFIGNDFSSEEGLYIAILTLGGAAPENIDMLALGELKSKVKDFFDNNSCFVVIDDIDTLTTAGEEGGLDFLYGVLWRAKKRSKLLYTLRNRPSHSIKSAIEVPGLVGDDYHDFVDVCAKQFGVKSPDNEFRGGPLQEVSEGRPLVLESIIALKRNVGSYENALRLFEKGAGDDVRRYVFEREWNAINVADRGRELLALLALHGKPLSFADLCAVSRLDASKLKDAIASIQEMFLIVDDNGVETRFSLGDLTKDFVLSASKELNLYQTIIHRVENFKKNHYPEFPALGRLYQKLSRAEYDRRHNDYDRLEDLWRELNGDNLDPALTENPRYLTLRGYVALLMQPQFLDRARMDFNTAFEIGYPVEVEYLRFWLFSERQSDTGDQQIRYIVDKVIESKNYQLSVKTEFRFSRATYLYALAREAYSLEPRRSIARLSESLRLHLTAYYGFIKSDPSGVRRSEEYTRNTAFYYIQKLSDFKELDQFIEVVQLSLKEDRVFIDPLVEPISFLFQSMMRGFSHSRGDLQRTLSRLEALQKTVDKNSCWCMDSARTTVIEQLAHQKIQIQDSIAAAAGR